ncbi:MAG: glycosyltransferase [Candidatus Dormiibacterota bacterium]
MSDTVVVVAEEAAGFPDEAYVKFVQEVYAGLARIRRTLLLAGGDMHTGGGPGRAQRRLRRLLSSEYRSQLREWDPAVVVYCSRSSVTPGALLRARMLRRLAPAASLVIVGLQPRNLAGVGARMAGRLWPDLVLVSTKAERHRLEALGARADLVWGGVDLDSFRAPDPGERRALRRKWNIDDDQRVLLHLGHLMRGRNLEALLPLAAEPKTTVIVVASSVTGPDSARLATALTEGGVRLVTGPQPHVEEMYRIADCYVFTPTSTDNAVAMPLSVIEAFASDLPVVSMRFGALQERFGDSPGLRLVDDPGDLSSAVAGVLAEHASTVALAADYSWDAVASRILGLAEQAIPTGASLPASDQPPPTQ